MFLKRIELFGFKSFPDKTEIELANGITALLGPNGCGKSNVVDAVKWVLGEQSSKILRAGKMDDLIFNGTEERKALNVAEVTLTLEANEHEQGNNFTELCIKRRLFRNGDNEYYLNSVLVRLRDIREMLFDEGISRSTYTIIEQGKVDQILSSKPEDRRYLFEEASKIAKYRSNWQESAKKLQRTDENIRQIENILSEVRRNYTLLKKQSEQTREYLQLKKDVFETERDIHILRLKSYHQQKSKKESLISMTEKSRVEIGKEVEKIDKYLEENLSQVNLLEQKLNDSNRNIYGLSIEKRNIASHSSSLSERIQEVGERIHRDMKTEKESHKKHIMIAEESKRIIEQISNCDTAIKEATDNIREIHVQIKNAQTSLDDNAAVKKRIDRENQELDTQLHELQSSLQELTDDIVQQLDEKLQFTNTSVRKEVESELDTVINSLKQHIHRQKQGLSYIPAPEENGAMLLEFFQETLLSFEEIYEDIVRKLAVYRESIPVFIEDFLAPEGIIIQKRQIDTKLLDIHRKIKDNRSQILALKKKNDELYNNIGTYKTTLQELRLGLERITASKMALQREDKNILGQKKELKQQEQINKQKIAEDKGRMQSLQKQLTELQTKDRQIREQEKNLQNEQKIIEKEISSQHKKLSSREIERKKQMNMLSTAQNRYESNQMSLAEINTEIRNLYSNFRDRYSRDLNEFEEMEITDDMSVVKARFRTNQEKLRSFGSVNLMAISDFTEVEERYAFLTTQLDDLTQAKKDLKLVIQQIQEESTHLFMKSYEQIRKNFNSIFRKLFGGGRAELRLLNPENALESGIELYAQPPGKKLENILLLSGGERSLTAIALLFAAYMLNPAPFCILDEIDAALDEANIRRFIAVLNEFSYSSQFIVITHSKRTASVANTLLGVTMEEFGVSKTVAIRAEETSESKNESLKSRSETMQNNLQPESGFSNA